ncbi:hypothetical protein ESB13_21790 [Filimonas effusa]|uniref:Tetratricopeptide repeat protein n=2 Tax=Filimonas effusa TaxID=2508721 RepID=A0A4V1M9G8_9BACT|nr:hypothetical protein ESB13_21790 [Filimonas effusa]
MPVFFSCATYHERVQSYYDGLRANNYQQANRVLVRNKLIQARRNRLLFYLERGSVAHLLHQYDTSNYYFNLADQFMEAPGSAWDIAVGTITNPMMQTYRGEDFERFMVHYYKALNYLYLHKPEDAIVEARRITLTNNAQKDKFNDKSSRYSQDAFSLIMQGLLYESQKDINNAFISYRNAADLYLRQPDHSYYGVPIPEQLEFDLLRTAAMMGFTDQVTYYEKQFNLRYKPEPALAGGELIVFVENGLAPYKKEDNYFFTLIKNEAGFFFTDNNNLRLPVDFSVGIDATNLSVKDIGLFRLALPSYVIRPLGNSQFETSVEGNVLNGQKIQDINYVAKNVLSERTLKEMSLALSRLLLKKLAEKQVKDKNDAAGSVLEIVNFLTEKADTRNWQSLPANIYYLRIPLKTGQQQVKLTSGGNLITTIDVVGNGGMQFYNYRKM